MVGLRVSRPFIDVRMLRANRPLSRTYARVAVTYAVFYTIFYGVPQWLEQGRLLSSAGAGLVVLPIAGMGIVATVIATRRPRLPLLVIGSAGLLVGSLALLLVGAATPVLLLVIVSAVLGIPNGFNSLGNQTAMYAAAPDGQVGTASGLYRTSQYIGANLAAALVGLGLGDHATDTGLHLLAVVISSVSLLLLAAAVLRMRRREVVDFQPR